MSRGFQQLERIDDLGDELPYLRGELIHRLRGMAKGRVLRMLETPEGEALFIQQLNRVYVYPLFSDLVGEAPYLTSVTNAPAKPGCSCFRF